jgi:hypothetical protein
MVIAVAATLARELKTAPGARWGQERRLEFIEFRLLWDGRINRSALVDHFGISVPQASIDLSRYAELAPANLSYDKTAKAYLIGPRFAPVFGEAQSRRYLTQLWSLGTGLESPRQSFIGWHPELALVRMPERNIDVLVLATILRGIGAARQVRVNYQSLSQPDTSRRSIEPHALAHDGSRWHVRAWCAQRRAFRDFVLSRIHSATLEGDREVDPKSDAHWHQIVEIEVAPRAGLTPAQRATVAHEYDMEGGLLRLSTRAAMLHYVVRHLQLDRPATDPNAPPLIWRNRTKLAHHLLPNM